MGMGFAPTWLLAWSGEPPPRFTKPL